MNKLCMSALRVLAAVVATFSLGTGVADARPLKLIGIAVGDLVNRYFVAMERGAKDTANRISGSDVKVTIVSSKYDLNTQVGLIENFVANKEDLILVNAVDPKGIAPALKRARDAGVVVIAVDVGAQGADATVMTDNLMAGAASCTFLTKHLGGKGNVVIINGPPVTAVFDRVSSCKQVLATYNDIHLLSDNQIAGGSRDGGLTVMANLLTAQSRIDGVFAINDPTAIGAELPIKQAYRGDVKQITSVDGAPDAEAALKNRAGIFAETSLQDPYKMAVAAVTVG
jgi:ribose transport system substrate-binding protein